MTQDKLDIVLENGSIQRYCMDCPRTFLITKTEQDFYKKQQWPLPKRDKECRMVRRQSRTESLR